MNVQAKLEQPDAKLTMSITMTLAEWKRIHSQLVSGSGQLSYVTDDLARHLRSVLGKVEQTFAADNLAD